MIKVLHIVPFEKYTDCVVDMWNKSIAQCRYVCVNKPSEVIYNSYPPCVQMISEEKLAEMIKLGDYDVVTFSSLPSSFYKYVLLVPKDKKIIWQSVGYDIYASNFPYRSIIALNIYMPRTHIYIKKHNKKSILMQIRHIFSIMLKPVTNYKKRQNIKKLETDALSLQNTILRRIDYVSTVLESEYELLIYNSSIQAKYFSYKYLRPFEVSYGIKRTDFDSTKYVLIGNSGDETNNHLDILNALEIRDIKTPLFVPLAYGGDKDYVDMLSDILCRNSKNLILRQFTERSKYLELLYECRAAVFGHIRQQALGNINVMLVHGCKVFLYKDSITYKYYKQKGLHIYSIEDDLFQKNIDTPLSTEQILHNRRFFEIEYERTLASFKKDVIKIDKDVKAKI